MSKPKSKILTLTPKPSGGSILDRLEKLGDVFLGGLQETRAISAELKRQAEVSPKLEKFLDVKEVAELFGEPEKWVYQQAKAKKLPAIKIGKYWKFSPSELQKWIEGQRRTS